MECFTQLTEHTVGQANRATHVLTGPLTPERRTLNPPKSAMTTFATASTKKPPSRRSGVNFTDRQVVVALLTAGWSRARAAKYVRCSLERLEVEAGRNSRFSHDMSMAETNYRRRQEGWDPTPWSSPEPTEQPKNRGQNPDSKQASPEVARLQAVFVEAIEKIGFKHLLWNLQCAGQEAKDDASLGEAKSGESEQKGAVSSQGPGSKSDVSNHTGSAANALPNPKRERGLNARGCDHTVHSPALEPCSAAGAGPHNRPCDVREKNCWQVFGIEKTCKELKTCGSRSKGTEKTPPAVVAGCRSAARMASQQGAAPRFYSQARLQRARGDPYARWPRMRRCKPRALT